MKTTTAIAVLAIAAALGGCATTPQQRYQADLAAMNTACDFHSRPALQPIVGKIPLSPAELDDIPLSMLADDTTPTPPEKAAIDAYWHDWSAACKPIKDRFLATYFVNEPSVISVANLATAARRQTLTELAGGNQTYAEANRSLQQIGAAEIAAVDLLRSSGETPQQAAAIQALSVIATMQADPSPSAPPPLP